MRKFRMAPGLPAVRRRLAVRRLDDEVPESLLDEAAAYRDV